MSVQILRHPIWMSFPPMLAFAFLVNGSLSLAADTLPTSPRIPVIRTVDGKVYIGSDPNNSYQVLCQLLDHQVQEYVGMSERQVLAHAELIRTFQKDWIEAVRAERAGEVAKGTTAALIKSFVNESEVLLEELLTPSQYARVRNAMYRIESKRIGLGEALTQGRLAQEIGIYEDQKAELAKRAREIELRIKKQILKIRAEAEQELLAELSPEQRKKARQSLGEQFDHEELPAAIRTYRRMRATQQALAE